MGLLDSGSTAYVSVSILVFVGLWVAMFFLLNSEAKEVRKEKLERDANA